MALEYPFQAVLDALMKARQSPPQSAYAANALSTGLNAYNDANAQRMKQTGENAKITADLLKEMIAKGQTPMQTLPGRTNPMSITSGNIQTQDPTQMPYNIGDLSKSITQSGQFPQDMTTQAAQQKPDLYGYFNHNTNSFEDLNHKPFTTEQLQGAKEVKKLGEIGSPKPQLEGISDPKIMNRLTLMGKDMDPSGIRQGAFGVSKQVFDRAERLQATEKFVRDVQAGNPDKREMEGFAIGLQSLMSGSNQGAMELVKALVPKTLWGDAKGISEWLYNKPKGTDQQAFVNRMLGEIDYEKRNAAAQIKRTQFQRIAKWPDVLKSAPQEAESTLQSWGVNLDEYNNWKKNGAKQDYFMKQTFEPKQPANAPTIGTIDSGYRFKGGNPADSNSWEKQ